MTTTLLTILSGGAAVAQSFTTWRGRRSAASSPQQLDQAAGALAWEVRAQWEAEASRRLLADGDPLPVQWRAETRVGGGGAGALDELVSSYADAPGRMVVIGEPGSGKTGLCVLLVLELLRRPALEHVPVLLQVSSWNPAENLYGWMIRAISENYPFLGDEARYGSTVVRDLLAQHRILPLLDGLDEMAEEQRVAALEAIVMDARGAEPLVLTSRNLEFEAANAAGIMRNARIVRLLPVPGEVAASYLRDTLPSGALERWEPVLSRLSGGDVVPAAQALRTPLMLFLARAAYADSARDPREILNMSQPHTVEEHLLDVFIRQAFAGRPPSPLPNSPRPVRHWEPTRAEQWLAFLARNCDREIAWWQLYRLVPFTVRLAMGVIIGGIPCTLLGWLMFGLFGRPAFGALLGLAIGAAGGVTLSFVPPSTPRRFVPRPLRSYGLARDLVFGAIGALVGGIVVGVLWGPGFGAAAGLVFGLAFGVVQRFTEPTEPREAVTPAGVLRSDGMALVYAAGLGGVTGVLVGAVMGGVVGAANHGLIVPVSNPVLVGLLGGAVGGVIGASGLGLVTQASSAAGVFTVTRVWLALRGCVPFRLMTFLEDAHQRGVLRQVGPYYQFRHAALQDRLALRP